MKKKHKSVLRLPLEKRAELALREAVEEVISEHLRMGIPLYVGRDGRVVKLSPKEARRLSRSAHRKSARN